MELLLVTGMSGAGKSRALQTLEDIGYFCVDNLPPHLLLYLLDEETGSAGRHERMAVTVDIRCAGLLNGMESLLRGLREKGVRTQIVFLDASDETLRRRYKETRRLHPLILSGDALDLSEAITSEREKLSRMRQMADIVLDTSRLQYAQLRQKLMERFGAGETGTMVIEFVSCGFKYGILADADLDFDVRCLPNPFYVESLRSLTGSDQPVREYVMSTPEARALFDKIRELLEFSLPMYIREGKMQLTVGFGCTGGQHRSMAFAGLMKEYFSGKYPHVKLSSRDAAENRFELASRLADSAGAGGKDIKENPVSS